MLKRLFALALPAALLLIVGATNVRAADIDISFFYQELAPYGEWVTLEPYGWVWCPYDVGPGWRPYTDGDWVYSDYGWTFVSPQDWGWAVFHYGRWGFDTSLGWFWVPGTVWGPAWVAWRYGDDYMGWAPLPPGVGWSFSAGLELGGFDLDYGIAEPYWSFCPVTRFTDPHVGRYLVNPARNVTLINMTRNVTNYTVVNNRVIDNNIRVSEMERATRRRIREYRIAGAQGGERPGTPRISGGEVRMFRPEIRQGRPGTEPKNVLPPRLQGSREQMARRQEEQKRTFNSYFQARSNELKKHHQQEMKRVQRSPQRESNVQRQENMRALEQRQARENRAFQEQQRREMRMLENRHAREQQMFEARHRNEPPRRKDGGQGKKKG
jgi:hypothetical protein